VRVSIVGFGLIGGSIARALRARAGSEDWHVTAWSRTMATVEQAVADGVVDAARPALEDVIEGSDLVVLAAPPLTCLELLDQIGGPLRAALPEDTTVTDVASAKASVVARADAARLPFVGGHPMAGREQSGYSASLPELFVGRPWVTVPGRYARLEDGERVGELIRACGAMAIPMHAEAHDRAVAAISHMPLVVSTALVEAVVGRAGEPDRGDWEAISTLAATGWASMTRLARGEPSMGAGIVATNGPAVAARLRELRAVLDEWIAALESGDGPDSQALKARFAAARARLDEERS
jgi:prephenate dehydrogenase